MVTGFGLVLLGYSAILIHRNILKMVIGFSLVDSGIAIIVVALGYVQGGTAPILDADTTAATVFVDPINAALAVTAIVIGFAVTAITLAYAIRLYRLHGTLNVDAFTESRE
ncbi:sodium:proton antiporter [Sedimentitalea sp. JM2-8]|uniref:Sodium:proton antiporter n=2 Tax=Sedimentitalea xiamensis TaxID=3050037 RepID=A0ABT7FCQ1_9RHOB|nr:sodium:proton antiporter [Sedimentitalea xiamensis]